MAGFITDNAQKFVGKYFGIIPFHTILIATYVWLLPYSENKEELFFESVLPAIVISITAAAALISLYWLLLGNGCAAGLMSTLIIVCLAYYGHVFDAIDEAIGGSVRNRYFMPIWVVLFFAPGVLCFIFRSRLQNVTIILNVSALALVAVPVGSLILGASEKDPVGVVEAAPKIFDQAYRPSSAPSDTEYPDIYYLIFDRYADRRTLNEIFEYDNKEFLDHLRGLGFYVADRSRANYIRTAYSLASNLNLRHLTFLSETVGPGSSDWKPLYVLLQDHEVARFLKARGYRYLHLGSWWEPTRSNAFADENFHAKAGYPWDGVSLNEFEWLLLEPTLPIRFMSLLLNLPYYARRWQFVRVPQKFAKLAAQQRRDTPLFAFAHMLVPHTPFMFFPDGRYKTQDVSESLTRDENYVDQLGYVNRKIKELVHELLKKEPGPIIVIQSDEGPFPARYSEDRKSFDWREATMGEIKQKFGIINAIYFPDQRYDDLYEDITPINTFRLIFNRYFGQTLPMLPDTSYAHVSENDLYSFIDVTEAAR